MTQPGTSFRDSIASAPSQNDIYHVGAPTKPDHKPQSATLTRSGREDMLESTKQRLERLHLKRILGGNFRTPNGKPTVVILIGRYVVAILFSPPYFFFYSMPKWLIGKAMPHVAKVLQKVMANVQQVLRQVTQALQLQLKRVSQALKDLTLPIRKGMRAGIKRLTTAVKAYIQRVVKTLGRVFQAPVHLFQRGTQFFQKAIQKLQNLRVRLQKSLKEIPRKLLGQVKAQFKQVIHTVQKLMQKAVTPFVKLAETMEKGWKHLYKAAAKLSEMLKTPFSKGFFEPIKTLSKKVQELTRASIEKAKEILTPVKEKIQESVQIVAEHLNHARQKVQEAAQTVVNYAVSFGEQATQALQQAGSWVLVPFVNAFQASKNVVNFIANFAQLRKMGVVKILRKLGKAATLAQEIFVNAAKGFGAFVKQGWKKAKPPLMAAFKKMVHIVGIAANYLESFLRLLGKWMLIALFWIRVAGKILALLMRELIRDFLRR